nr:universal stress protein PHOS32-like protein [Agave sisalana]
MPDDVTLKSNEERINSPSLLNFTSDPSSKTPVRIHSHSQLILVSFLKWPEMGGNRTVGIGMDYSPMSKTAVRWVIGNLVAEGDRIVLIHVQPSKSESPQKTLWGDTGTPLIPLDEFKEMNLPKQYGINPDPEVLQLLEDASKTKKGEGGVQGLLGRCKREAL